MTMKTHVACTVAAYSAVAVHCTSHDINFMGLNNYIVMGIGFLPMIGASLFPDVDIKNSRASNRFPIFHWFLSHRTITHEAAFASSAIIAILMRDNFPLAVPILAGILFAFTPLFFLNVPLNIIVAIATGIATGFATRFFPILGQGVIVGFALGWLLHIIEDAFNSKGVYVCHAKISIAKIKTRTWQETVFTILWIGGCLIWVLQNLGLLSVMDLFKQLVG